MSRDDLGSFCTPQPEEWWWNSEITRCSESDEQHSTTDDTLCSPRTVFLNEEAQTMEKDELVLVAPVRRKKSSDIHITMRYQNQVDVLEWRQRLPNSTERHLSTTNELTTKDHGIVKSGDCFLPIDNQASTTRNGSRASNRPSIMLNVQEEQVFFDKVRKQLPAVQRSISDEVLRCWDRLREDCECPTCDQWREMKLKIKKPAKQEDSWKAIWKFVLGRESSMADAGVEGYDIDVLF